MYLDYIRAPCSNSFLQEKNTIGAKRFSKSSNPVTFSIHRVGQKSGNLFFFENLVHVP